MGSKRKPPDRRLKAPGGPWSRPRQRRGEDDQGIGAADWVGISDAWQGFPFFAAFRWPAGWAVAVERRAQAAAGGTAALNGKAGGKAQSGKRLMISLARALRLATPARKLVTNSR